MLRVLRCVCREPEAHAITPNSTQPFNFRLNTQHVLGPVDAEVGFFRVQYMDFKTVLQGSQLFERFGGLERRRRQLREPAQDAGLITVDADVTPGDRARAVRNRRA